MIRIYILALNFCILAGFAIPARADRNKHSCQFDLFKTAAVKPAPASPPRLKPSEFFADFPALQRKIWSHESAGENDPATYLRRILETQLIISRLKAPAANFGRNTLFTTSGKSLLLYLPEAAGRLESAAYAFNESLGRPVRIPTTVNYLKGAVQVWIFDDAEDEMLSAEEDRLVTDAVATDADLALFNFLVSIAPEHAVPEHAQKAVLDPGAGLVVSNFAGGFRYSVRHFFPHVKNVKDVADLLRGQLKNAKFDWVSAMNRLDLDLKLENVNTLAGRNLNATEARDLGARLCLLKAVVNGSNISDCPFL